MELIKVIPHARLKTIISAGLHRVLTTAILAVFFFIPWWLRPDGLPHIPYFAGFLVTIPVVLAILCWIALGAPGLREATTGPRFWMLVTFGLLLVWALLSPRWAIYTSNARDFSEQFVVVALFALVVMCAGPSARSITVALAMGLIVQGVVVVGQMEAQRPVGLSNLGEFEIRPNNVGLNIVMAGTSRLMRPYGLTIHPNVIGGYFTVALLALSGWLMVDPGLARWRQIVRLIILALGLWALCLTFSRSAIGGLVLGGILIAVAQRRPGSIKPIRVRLPIVGVVGIAVVILFVAGYGKYVLARTATGGETTEMRSLSDRGVYIRIALQLIGQNPLTGVGIANFPAASAAVLQTEPNIALVGDNVHNLPLLVTGELGLVGLLFWGVTLLIGLWIAWRSTYDPFAIGLVAGVVALLGVGMLDHYPWTIMHFALLLWASLGAAIGHPAGLLHKVSATEPLADQRVIESQGESQIAAPDQTGTEIDRVAQA